ncbi:hypothetical protein [Lonepinella koalarum]|uniref:hypothetical protein n=1 Tax=Lonepinella koalarum TaxID=53417 RepID=UPI003F6DCFD4
MEFSQSVGIGLDIATALSVIIAAYHYVNSAKKETKRKLEEDAKQAEKLRQQRIAESGSIVLTREIRTLSEAYRNIIEERSGVEKSSVYFMQQKTKNEKDDHFYKRCLSNLSDKDKVNRFFKEYDEYMTSLSNGIEIFSQQRYVIIPVLDAISQGNNSLVSKLKKSPSNLVKMYNHLGGGVKGLWRDLNELRELLSQLSGKIDFDTLYSGKEDNQLYSDILKKLIRIVTDSDYSDFLEGLLLSKDEFTKYSNISADDEYFESKFISQNLKMFYKIALSEQGMANLFHNMCAEVGRSLITSTTEFKAALCLLSACHSYILNDRKDISLDDEIKRYEGLFALGVEIR